MSNTELAVSDAIEQLPMTGLPDDIQQRIMAAAAKIKNSSTVSVSKIRNDDRAFIFPDNSSVASFKGIIVATQNANMHYDGEYEEGIINPPNCVAVGTVKNDELTPLDIVENPYHTNCKDCPKFQWKSDRRGKGKACAEYVLLAIYVPAMGDDLYLLECKKKNAQIASSYLKIVSNKYNHPVAVLTNFQMGAKDKWVQSFETYGMTNTDLLINLANRIDEGTDMLFERIQSSYRSSAEVSEPDQSTNDTNGRKARSK